MIPKTIDCSKADELLDAMSLRQPMHWDNRPREWIFRGQSDATQALIPKALRPEYAMQGIDSEIDAYVTFLRLADAAGLPVAGFADLRDINDSYQALVTRAAARARWPPWGLISPLALAQHHSCCLTGCLGWSLRPQVAAYFPAAEVVSRMANQEPLSGDKIAVWALDRRFVLQRWDRKDDDSEAELEIVSAGRSTNRNLHAQGGLFTVDRNPERRVGLDATLQQRTADDGSFASPLLQFTLPHDQAPALLDLLDLEGINGATVFPDYDGVGRAVMERLALVKLRGRP